MRGENEQHIFWHAALVDLARTVRFYSLLPLPALPFEDPHAAPDFRTMPRLLPLAGAIIGIPPALVLLSALLLDFGPWLAAALSVTAMTLVTGAFHEDGLADTADGFGGATRERRLAIMKDSLIGSFGASALVLAYTLRIGALAALADRLEPLAAAVAVVIVAALSRTSGLVVLTLLPSARPEGTSRTVGRPTRETLVLASALAAAIAIVLGVAAGLPRFGIALMLVLSALSGWLLTRLSARFIGGQTGDVAGASQQVAEVLAMLGLLLAG
jgi:adenosylcobinamide-GDP ribazoletransferase